MHIYMLTMEFPNIFVGLKIDHCHSYETEVRDVTAHEIGLSWLGNYWIANRFYLGPGSDDCHPVNQIIPWCHGIFNR